MSAETSVSVPHLSDLTLSESALLETLLREAPIGVAFFTADLRLQYLSRALAAVYGRSTADCVGRTPGEILDPESAAAHESALAAILTGQRRVHGDRQAVGGSPESPEAERYRPASWFPAHDTEGNIAGAVLVVDLGDTRVVEAERRRDEERYRSLLRASGQILWVASPDGETVEDSPEWRAVTGQDVESYLGHGWLDAVHPDDRAHARDTWLDAVAEREIFEMTFRVRTRSGEYRHYRSRAVPILREGEVVEWVGTHTDVTTQREADEMRHRLTQQLSEAALRTVRLQKATADLAEALTVEQVVDAITEIGHSEIGVDRLDVALLDEERIRLRPVHVGADRAAAERLPEEISVERPGVMANAIREGGPVIAGSPLELRAALGEADGLEEFLRHTPERAWVGLPLVSAGSPIGVLRLAFHRPRGVSEEEKVFLEALAGQCSLALERAEMFEREHRTAVALQRSLLPEELPEVTGIRFASLYRSGTQHVQVGGDWYDGFVLPDGRVAAVVGDVMGKGVKAATGMSRVRNALRALAFTSPDPADVLAGLDRMFEATEGYEQMTTLAYCALEPETGYGYLGNAGHLPPLLVAPAATSSLLETEPGTPLGMPSARDHDNFLVSPGNTVVLYSDGLVENRSRGLVSGLNELVTVASRAPAEVVGDPQRLLDYLVENMLAGYEQDDDVTLLAVHIPVL